MTKPLQVGEKYAVYGHDENGINLFDGEQLTLIGLCDYMATLKYDSEEVRVHVRQCVPLKPKKKRKVLDIHVKYSEGSKQWVECRLHETLHPAHTNECSKRVREVLPKGPKKPGKRITGEDLAAAIQSVWPHTDYMSELITETRKKLGLSPGKEK